MEEKESARLAKFYIQSLKDFGRKFSPGERNAIYLSECARNDDENQANQGTDYTDQQARIAAVHARQDIAGVYGYSAFIAKRITRVYHGNILVILLLLLILWRVW